MSKPRFISVYMTEDEINLAAYAVSELGGRRAEQALERKSDPLRAEADACFKLSKELRDCLS